MKCGIFEVPFLRLYLSNNYLISIDLSQTFFDSSTITKPFKKRDIMFVELMIMTKLFSIWRHKSYIKKKYIKIILRNSRKYYTLISYVSILFCLK